MMSFNPWNVILLLYATFFALDLPQSPIISEEIEVKEKVEYILKEIGNDNEFEIEEEQILDFYDPNEIPHAEIIDLLDHVEDENYLPEEVICTSVEAYQTTTKGKLWNTGEAVKQNQDHWNRLKTIINK
ncbi:uncharacterized protein LOC116845370 [Odontomachus brunneus]|uniref:uncharacterized protein LOC116845370 n=1 Tax=Odontomachus brunneus TaxID=486640 RepID=UPI0013F22A80|nr:uncharacterized protein LOC116845370 [Odontomachus brunneus]